jgi:hypothetical protein
MPAFSAGTAQCLLPVLVFAQANPGPSEASRKFRAYLDEDGKRWMPGIFRSGQRLLDFPGRTAAGLTIREKALRLELITSTKVSRN